MTGSAAPAQKTARAPGSLASGPTKQALLVLERRMEQIFVSVVASIAPDAPLRPALRGFGVQFGELVLSQSQIALVRMVYMESARFAQLGARFFELGPGRGVAVLASYLAVQSARGTLRAHEPHLMAQQYLGMIAGCPVVRYWSGCSVWRRQSARSCGGARYIRHAIRVDAVACQSGYHVLTPCPNGRPVRGRDRIEGNKQDIVDMRCDHLRKCSSR